ncbi:MAG: acyl-CoA dehydrogenase family protein [Pseudomonadota bacterium]
MEHHKPQATLATHEVTNQPPPFLGVSLFSDDDALVGAVRSFSADDHVDDLSQYGARCGSAEVQEWGDEANRQKPELINFDRYGHRVDEVRFHPAYHKLLDLGLSAGVSGGAWRAEKNGHVLHAGLMYLTPSFDCGVCCPMSMTYAAVPALRHDKGVAEEWVPRVTALEYDQRFLPAAEKRSATLGMAMTEKQGGSDVRANTTRAEKTQDGWRLTGHKWFCSAPMSDAFLTLAYTDKGMTCFLVPRWTPDGERNQLLVMRLKNKMGDHSNASSEIEYHGAFAWKLGEEGRGVPTIIDMVQHTRLDCVVGSAGSMRTMLARALWHTSHRTAFQRTLIDQPAMRRTLADLVVESEAAIALTFRLAGAFDRAAVDPAQAAFTRLATPLAKYWVCKRQPNFAYEALECFGGAGFIEEAPMARYFRASPLNAIWEGSGNVIALDVLRALSREPEAIEAVNDEFRKALGTNAHYDHHVERLSRWFCPGALDQSTARRFAEDMGLALSAVALRETAPDFVFDAYCNARLDVEERGLGYGATAAKMDEDALLNRASFGSS